MDAASITAIGGIITGLTGILIAVYTAVHSAKTAELEVLRCTIGELQKENTRMSERLTTKDERIDELEREVDKLQKQIEERDSRIKALEDRLAVWEKKRRQP